MTENVGRGSPSGTGAIVASNGGRASWERPIRERLNGAEGASSSWKWIQSRARKIRGGDPVGDPVGDPGSPRR